MDTKILYNALRWKEAMEGGESLWMIPKRFTFGVNYGRTS
jgi:hypothetical protein